MREPYGKLLRLACLSLLLGGLGACEARGKPLQLGETRPDADEAEIADRLIDAIKQASLNRHPDGEIKRFNQGKGLGCFAATFAAREGAFAG